MSNPWYRDYADFLGCHFSRKMQKLAVNAGLSCPNRDGTIGTGGCSYCNNRSFNPAYCTPGLSVRQQIERGREFFGRKYPDMGYLAYFQVYTNTHGDADRLMAMYREAVDTEGVEGLIIGTRPDCMPDHLLRSLASLGCFVMIEYGAETSCDATLAAVNRCHTWADTVDAVIRTKAAGLPVGLHLIMGLPGEDEATMMATIDDVNRLPVDVVKIHQLQIVRGTRLAQQIERGEVSVAEMTLDWYLDLCCRIVSRLRPDIAIERFVSQSPADLLISPRWGLKNYEFTNLLHNKLKKNQQP